MRQRWPLSAVLICGACVHLNTDRSTPVVETDSYVLNTALDESANGFAVVLTSKTDVVLCVDFRQWPDSNGELRFSEGRVWVQHSWRKFPIKQQAAIECVAPEDEYAQPPYACQVVFAPRSITSTRISLSNFQGLSNARMTSALSLEGFNPAIRDCLSL